MDTLCPPKNSSTSWGRIWPLIKMIVPGSYQSCKFNLGMKSCPLVNSPNATRATQQLGESVLSECKGVCLLNCRDLPSQRSPSITDHALMWGNFCLRVSANLSIARNCAGSSSCRMALSWGLMSSRSDTSWVANENYVAVLIVSPEMTGGSCWARQSHWIYPNIRDTYVLPANCPCTTL